MEDLERTIALLSESDEFVEYTDEVVLVIGNKGSGKSAAVRYISADMENISFKKVDDKIILVVGDDSGARSSTNFPSLISYRGHNFYNCPGFDHSRDNPHAVVASHLIREVLCKAKKVKLVLVADYPSIKSYPNSNFIQLIEETSQLVKNFSKFKFLPSLIVSKVKGSDFDPTPEMPYSKTTDDIINCAIDKLNLIKTDIVKEGSSFRKSEQFLSNSLELLESLVRIPPGKPPKIFLFREPETEGPLTDNRVMVDEKFWIQDEIAETPYVSTTADDFGFPDENIMNEMRELTISDIVSEIMDISKLRNDILEESDLQSVNSLRSFEELKAKLEGIDVINKFDIQRNLKKLPKVNEIVDQFDDDLMGMKRKNLLEGIERIVRKATLLKYLQIFEIGNFSSANNDWLKKIVLSLPTCDIGKDWRRFIVFLYVKLSGYELQINRKLYNVKDPSCWGKGGAEGIFITANNVAQFINKLKETIFKDGQELPDPSSIIGSKLDELNEVLSLTVKQKVDLKLVDDVATVKQNIICLSEVVEALKKPEYAGKSLNIFATDRIFINSTLDRPSCDTSMIAPTIDVIGEEAIQEQMVYLKGTDLGAFNPPKAATGADGSDGRPGNDGGNFLAVTLSSLDRLVVHVGGGRGEDGQSGSDGTPGQDGTDADAKGTADKQKGVDWEVVESGFNIKMKFFGKKGYKGGNGAKGGNGGKGGSNGVVFTTGNSVSSIRFPGRGGVAGSGGKAGLGGKHGRDRLMKRSIIPGMRGPTIQMSDLGLVNMNPERADSGSDGVAGVAGVVGSGPSNDNDTLKMASEVAKYKLYALEMEKRPFFRRLLTTFSNQVLCTNKLDRLYKSIIALYNEMIIYEKDYYGLRGCPRLIALYRDLLGRVARFPSTAEQNQKIITENDKRSLQVLYTAILTKICSLEKGSERTLVINISRFIDTTISEAKILKEKKYTETLVAEKKKYGDIIKSRISEANVLIKSQVFKGVDDLIEKTKAQIPNLIKEVAELEKDLKKQAIAVEKLEAQLILSAVLGIVKNVANFLDFLGPVGEATNVVIQMGVGTLEMFNEVDKTPLDVKELPEAIDGLKKVQEEAKNSAKKRLASLEEMLKEMKSALEEVTPCPVTTKYMLVAASSSEDPLTRARSEVDEMLKLIQNSISTNEQQPDEDGGRLQSTITEVEDRTQAIAQQIENNNAEGGEESSTSESKEDRKKRVEKAVKRVKDVVKGYGYLKDAYKDFKGVKADLDKATKASEKLTKQLQDLDKYDRQVREVMAPSLNEMGKDLKRVSKTLSEKSQVVLDVAKWKVQSRLREMKRALQKSTEGFKVQAEFSTLFDEITEAMTTMIGLYDRIENYKHQAELADYIADMNNRGFGIERIKGELGDSVREMRLIIQTNIVLDRFEACVGAVKQWVFPFAVNFLGAFKLPDQLEPGQDINTMIDDAVTKMESLKTNISDYYSSLQPQRRFIRSGDFGFTTSKTRPIASWTQEKHSTAILKLLSGDGVLLPADPALGSPQKAAVKFNNIRLNFKVADKQAQDELYSELEKFSLHLTHMGNSYYRFKNKIYVIHSEQIQIAYTITKSGEPFEPDEILTMLTKGDILLSPYAMWGIRLTKNTYSAIEDFSELKKFASQVDLELVGEGKYLDENRGDLPDLDLDTYYTLHRVLSQ